MPVRRKVLSVTRPVQPVPIFLPAQAQVRFLPSAHMRPGLFKHLVRLAAAVSVTAIGLVIREAMRSLSESDPDEPWSPHRKGF